MLFSFFRISFFIYCSDWVISTILSSRWLICSSVLSNLLWFLLMLSSFQLLYIYCLFITFSNSFETFSKFFYSTLKFIDHPYDHFFEFFVRQIIFIYFIRVFTSFFFLVPLSGAYSSVSLFCLTFCVCFYESD